ncbi:MAG: helix-turn-helix transcriptional regulator [Nannocystaceae bacterium]|nr:helix-turn-helix transcriptional regulator [Nannocystaceae bacterium]
METIVEYGTADGLRWQAATGRPVAALRSAITRIQGYDERTDAPLVRSELPGAQVVLLIETGPPLTLRDADGVGHQHVGGFVAGLGPSATRTEHAGWQQGIQVNLTATSVRSVLGVPLTELSAGAVGLSDLFGSSERLASRVADADDWASRLALVQAWLIDRIAQGPAPDRRIAWAIDTIARSGGSVEIARVQRQVELSRPHFIRMFREHVGVTPKRYARLVRFERIVDAIRNRRSASWAALASDVGCYDQPHLAREIRALAGMTCTELAHVLGGPVATAFAG